MMSKKKLFNVVVIFMLTLLMLIPANTKEKSNVAYASENNSTRSQEYVEAMGRGWNLGNSFDGYQGNLNVADDRETAWGNPRVTKELIQSIKDRGYDSIRIPMPAYRRYSLVDNKYVMDENC